MNATPKPATRLTRTVTDLRRRLGQRMDVEIDLDIPRLEVIASRTTGAPVTGLVVIESIERGVTITGSISFEWNGDCRRCLEPVDGRADVDVFEIFQFNAPDDSEDIQELVDDTVDLVPVVRDAVLLALPLAPLCSDECGGPDPDRYPAKTIDQVEEEASVADSVADPRWSALDGLSFDD